MGRPFEKDIAIIDGTTLLMVPQQHPVLRPVRYSANLIDAKWLLGWKMHAFATSLLGIKQEKQQREQGGADHHHLAEVKTPRITAGWNAPSG
jgi:hypothetical protein